MATPRKTQTKITLNAKLSNVDLQQMGWDGTFSVIEGAPIKFDASGNAAVPTGRAAAAAAAAAHATEIVYVNFVPSGRTDTEFLQGAPLHDSLPEFHVDSGGLTGIRGSGLDIGLPADCWAGGVLPAVGEGVYVDAATGLFAAEALNAGSLYYGIVERVAYARAHFFFSSISRQLI